MRALALAVGVAALAGCGSDGVFYVSRDFSPADAADIQRAADIWDSATGGFVHYDLVFGADPSADHDRKIIRERPPQDHIGHTHRTEGLAPKIYIGIVVEQTGPPTCLGEACLQHTVLHEFGHVEGLDDSPVEGELMCNTGGCWNPDPNCIPRGDLEKFEAMYTLPPGSTIACD